MWDLVLLLWSAIADISFSHRPVRGIDTRAIEVCMHLLLNEMSVLELKVLYVAL